MNKYIFTGNLGNDAETKYLPNGTAVCEFSAAAKSGFGDNEKTLWIKCAMFGKRAEGQLPQYLVKGAKVCIAGELSMDEWEKDGVANKMLKVRVEDLDLIGAKQEGQQQPQQGQPMQQPQQHNQPMAQPQGGFAPQQQYPQNAAYAQPQGHPQQGVHQSGFPQSQPQGGVQQSNFNQGQQ
jgi:single-strand DNA-binding protein